MIRNHDRSGWFGASDTARIMGNWNTPTFAAWWLEKLGLRKNVIRTKAMQAGSAYEHRILDFLKIRKRDRQVKIRRHRLRVNLDGECKKIVVEVKTYSGDTFRITPAYWQQSQVEMYATRKRLEIAAYKMLPEDLDNYFNPIIGDRLSNHQVSYDPHWIKTEYLPRLIYLAHCLRKKVFPNDDEFQHFRCENTLRRRLLDLLEAVHNRRFAKSQGVRQSEVV